MQSCVTAQSEQHEGIIVPTQFQFLAITVFPNSVFIVIHHTSYIEALEDVNIVLATLKLRVKTSNNNNT